jgi:protein SCO1/2
MGGHCVRLLLLSLTVLAAAVVFAQTDDRYDPDRALQISQSAVGHAIGDYEFQDQDGSVVNLRDDYAGRPLVISMIFTSCHHVCPMTTKHLASSVRAAREALGSDSFDVVTIGFDTANDTPEAMRSFAKAQGVDDARWRFLSGSAATVERLGRDLGFIFFPTSRGFDHINQSTVVDRDGVVYRQVYGVTFELPWLVEPLKQLVFNRPQSAGHVLDSFIDRIKLFCTVYDPSSGRYEFDRSLFFRFFAGLTMVLGIALYLFREFRAARHENRS